MARGIQGSTAYWKDNTNIIVESDRLHISLDEKVQYLNVDKAILTLLTMKAKKRSVDRMKHNWLTQERKKDFVDNTAVGGAWNTSGTNGTLTVSTDDIFLFSEGDLLMIPENSTSRALYVTGANQSTGVVSAETVDGAAINYSAASLDSAEIFLMSNSFESGTGVGTIKTEQPSSEYNYVQIMQTPVGITTTGEKLNYRGQDEWNKIKFEAGVDHAFKIEKSMFFGERQRDAQGRMVGQYEQWYMGGINSYISTYATDASGALTRTEFDNWMIDWTKWAKSPFILCGELIFEALTLWSDSYLRITRNESTLGMAVTKVLTPYGTTVVLIPHRELLTGTYFGGMAFGIDASDLEYLYFNGLDTHVEPNVQAPGLKQKVDEIRTWCSLKVGNEKHHGLLYGVTSITT